MKKLLLGLGTLSLVALPTLALASCSSETKTIQGSLNIGEVTSADITTATTAIETYKSEEEATPGSGDKDALIDALNLKAFSGLVVADVPNFDISYYKAETITLTANSGFKFGTGKELVSVINSIPGSLNIGAVTSGDMKTTIQAIKDYKEIAAPNDVEKTVLITALNLKSFSHLTVVNILNFTINFTDVDGKETITLTANSGFKFGKWTTLISSIISIDINVEGSLKTGEVTSGDIRTSITAIETYQKLPNPNNTQKTALIDALNLKLFSSLLVADLPNYKIKIDKTVGAETITLTANSGFKFGTGKELVSVINSIPGSLNIGEVTSDDMKTTIQAIKDYKEIAAPNNVEKTALIDALNAKSFLHLTVVNIPNFTIDFTDVDGKETITLTAKNGIKFGTSAKLVSTTTIISTLALKDNPIVSTVIANAGIAGNAINAAKFTLFDLIWRASSPALTVDDMTNITITKKAGTIDTSKWIFTVASKGTIVLGGVKISEEITLTTTSTLSLKNPLTITTAIANAGIDGSAKWALFNLIWTGNPVLDEDDMTGITITKAAGTTDTSKWIFTVTSTGSITLIGDLVSNEITLTTTSTLSLNGVSTITTAIANAGIDGSAKWALFNLIWTGNPVLDEDDMTGIEITQSAESAGKVTFTVTSILVSLILDGVTNSGDITLIIPGTVKPIAADDTDQNATITVIETYQRAEINDPGSGDKDALIVALNLTAFIGITKEDLPNFVISFDNATSGSETITLRAKPGFSFGTGDTLVSTIRALIPVSLNTGEVTIADITEAITVIETYQAAEEDTPGSGDETALIDALNLKVFSNLVAADLPNFVITYNKTLGSETITLTAKPGFIFATGTLLVSKINMVVIPGSVGTIPFIPADMGWLQDQIRIYDRSSKDQAAKDRLIYVLNHVQFSGLVVADVPNFDVRIVSNTIVITAKPGFRFVTGTTLISTL